jgi:hypothetical protein
MRHNADRLLSLERLGGTDLLERFSHVLRRFVLAVLNRVLVCAAYDDSAEQKCVKSSSIVK